MIGEKDDELGIVTLNLRCIGVLCGYATNISTMPTSMVSFQSVTGGLCCTWHG